VKSITCGVTALDGRGRGEAGTSSASKEERAVPSPQQAQVPSFEGASHRGHNRNTEASGGYLGLHRRLLKLQSRYLRQSPRWQTQKKWRKGSRKAQSPGPIKAITDCTYPSRHQEAPAIKAIIPASKNDALNLSKSITTKPASPVASVLDPTEELKDLTSKGGLPRMVRHRQIEVDQIDLLAS
jgi:hypothetical protein